MAWPAMAVPVSPWSSARSLAADCEGNRIVANRYRPRPEFREPERSNSSERGCIYGCAGRLGIWFTCIHLNLETGEKEAVRGYQTVSSLDRFFDRLKSGRERTSFCFNHSDDIPFCDTSDGSLRIWLEGDEIRFRVDPVSVRSRFAIELARSQKNLREVSVGLRFGGSRAEVTDGEWIIDSSLKTRIHEISLVEVGGNPGNWVRIE